MTYAWFLVGTRVPFKLYFLKSLSYKDFLPLDYEVIKEILPEQIFYTECIQTAMLCGFSMYFNISPGRMLFSLYNCCCVWTCWWRFSSVMKPSSCFWHRHCSLWVYFFYVYRGFSFSTRLFLSEMRLRAAVPLRTLWCIFRSLLYASITNLSQDTYIKDVCCIYLKKDIRYIWHEEESNFPLFQAE